MNTFEEGVVFRGASSGFLIGMMTEDLFAVGAANLFFISSETVTREAEDGVVVLVLGVLSRQYT